MPDVLTSVYAPELGKPDSCEVLDPRIRRTRELLQQALGKLLEVKEFDKISVQDITDADALAEGIECAAEWREDNPPHICYSVLFDHINGPGTWLYNPWVTVIEFRR